MISFADGDTSFPFSPGAAPGATSVDAASDWLGMNVSNVAPLLQSGEDLWVVHYVRAQNTTSGYPQYVFNLIDAFTTSNVTLVDGQAKTLSGAFTGVPQNKVLSIDLRETQFLQGLDLTPDQPVSFSLRRRTALGAETVLSSNGVFRVDGYTLPLQADVTGSWTYGDPYPSTWTRYIYDYVLLTWTYHTRGTNLPDVYASVNTFERRPAMDSIVIAPFAAAPHAIKVGGVAASAAAAVPYDGTHAIDVTWAAVVGVDHYVVTVQQIDAPAGQPSLTVIATFDTSEARVSMPANLFTDGASYMISVAADQRMGVDYPGGELRRPGFPHASREAVTARLLFSASCGNGTKDASYEECDSSGVNTASCNADCTTAMCGDAIPNTIAGEQCDTGGDSVLCDSDCTNVMCGDGHLNMVAGEVCDQGANNGAAGGCCSMTCQYQTGHTSCP